MRTETRQRLAWEASGAAEAAARGDVVVVVDTLSFSTTVIVAVERGALVLPCGPGDDARALAREADADLALPRRQARELGGYSLSPLSFLGVPAGTRVVLPSPNGGGCCLAASRAPAVLVGALRNARACASAVERATRASSAGATVVACGERHEDGTLRVAIEDWLGAGAVLSHLAGSRSPEARVAVAAFEGCRDDLQCILEGSVSGRELADAGYPRDVGFASQLDASICVPELEDGWLRSEGG